MLPAASRRYWGSQGYGSKWTCGENWRTQAAPPNSAIAIATAFLSVSLGILPPMVFVLAFAEVGQLASTVHLILEPAEIGRLGILRQQARSVEKCVSVTYEGIS